MLFMKKRNVGGGKYYRTPLALGLCSNHVIPLQSCDLLLSCNPTPVMWPVLVMWSSSIRSKSAIKRVTRFIFRVYKVITWKVPDIWPWTVTLTPTLTSKLKQCICKNTIFAIWPWPLTYDFDLQSQPPGHFWFSGRSVAELAEWQNTYWSEAPQSDHRMTLQTLNVNIMMRLISRTWSAFVFLLRD